MDLNGHLNLICYSGGTATTHSIYTASDLRNAAWTGVTVTLTQTTWSVKVNGGLTASVSGTTPTMTSAWTWFLLNGDLGTSGGSTLAAIQHGGNIAYSHWAIYPQVLPAWRQAAHYAAAITGFGLLPAPQGLALSQVANAAPSGGSGTSSYSFTPDGSLTGGGYSGYALSVVATAQAGSLTSGPSERAFITGLFLPDPPFGNLGYGVWIGWSSLSPQVALYTASTAGAETGAAVAAGSGDALSGGYGSGTAGSGVCQVSGGTGASPPSGPSALGDTVAQRWERILGYGLVTSPNRAIDSSASLPVQAALDIGGSAAGQNLQNLVDSDNGLAFIDNGNTMSYRSRPHLAADTPAWFIGMNVSAGQLPFEGDVTWSSDPQQVYTAITIQPYSPDGATLPVITPSNATAVNAAQEQYNPRPKPVTSYLQSQPKMQSQANWLFATFGGLTRRAAVITIKAAAHPASWVAIAGMNVGDIAQIYDAPFGQPATTGNYRVAQIARRISNGANGSPVEGTAVLVLTPLPPGGYWT